MKTKIKCLVWDLDNTLWDGILLEQDNIKLKAGVLSTLSTLDNRGIILSIASKNDYDHALNKLEALGIKDLFLYPQISWSAKSVGFRNLQEKLNFGIDTFAFIDDQQYELDEVKSVFPQVTCFNAESAAHLTENPLLMPKHLTNDSKNRRLLYQADIKREEFKESFHDNNQEFLNALKMKFIISHAKFDDLKRVQELTERTNQINSTGKFYSYEELTELMNSDNHSLYICELTDVYGSYGKIGLALIEHQKNKDTLKLLLMSCRVISRGVGTVLLNFILEKARDNGRDLYALFKDTGRNRLMYVTYKFANFIEYEKINETDFLLKNDLTKIQAQPNHIQLIYHEESSYV